jgi:hypothetical protein
LLAKYHMQNWQRSVLWDLFVGLDGPINRQVRQKACKMTGLEWRKIYKWAFDQGSRLKLTYREKSDRNEKNGFKIKKEEVVSTPVEKIFEITKVKHELKSSLF